MSRAEASKVVVVDDSASSRFLISGMIRKAGYEVQECASGEDCLTLCEKQLPSIILLDFAMPGIDGLGVCRKLRERYSKIQLPIVMVTASAASLGAREALQVGANDYLTKPIERGVLLARLENQLSLQRSHLRIKMQQSMIEESLDLQRAIGDTLPEGLMVHDAQGRIVYTNRRLLEFCGAHDLKSLREVFDSIFGGRLAEAHARSWHTVSIDPGCRIDETYEINGAGQKEIVVHVSSTPLETLEGKPLLRLWRWRDLTETKALERAAKNRVKLETLSAFTLGVAHNFNNILGSILGASELLSRAAALDGRSRRCLEIIQEAVDNGKKFAGKMSVLVRRGRHTDCCSRERLPHVVETIVGIHRELTAGRITFTVEMPQNLPPIAMNPVNLMDVVANVVSNAVDAISGIGRITICAEARSGAVILRVTDDGAGMDAAVLEKVFDPFFSTKNLDQQNNVSVEGNGLGLWNVYTLLNMYGGEITIASIPGQGTEVVMRLPAAR